MTTKIIRFRSVLNLLTALIFLCFLQAQASQVKASSFGYNSSDASSALMAAFRSNYDTVIVDHKSAGWNVGPLTMFDIKNKVIIFESGVVLRAIAGRFNASNAKLLKLARPVNVTILGYGAKFKMNKAEYTNFDPNTEFRVSLEISDGVNITVKGLTIEESGGDGIYLIGKNSRNILLEDLNVINQSRSGLTIISANGLMVKNCDFKGTRGPVVGSGIKFEPHGSSDKFVDVVFENCRSLDNGQAGITFGLRNLNSSSDPLDVLFRDCYLSNNSIESRNNPNTEIQLSNGNNYFQPVQGLIKFENLVVENARESLVKSRKVATAFKAEFVNCSFKIRDESSANPIVFQTPSSSINTTHMGGFTFTNTEIEYNADAAFLGVYGSPVMEGLKDVVGNFTIANPNITESTAILYKRVNSYVNVNINFDLVSQLPPGGGGPNNCENNLNITANETSAITREASNTLTANNNIVHNSGTVIYQAGDKVSLKTGFSMRADSGEKFKAVLGNCTSGSTSLTSRIYPYSSNPSAKNSGVLSTKSILFPNPVISDSQLNYILEEDDHISIKIYDAKYQLVKSVMTDQMMFKGQQSQLVDFSTLVPGLYFVGIEGASKNDILKVIKK